MTQEQLLTAAALVLVGLVVTALWRATTKIAGFIVDQMKEAHLEIIEEKLMSPNGGSSLADLSGKIACISETLAQNGKAHERTYEAVHDVSTDVRKLATNAAAHLQWHAEHGDHNAA